MPKLSNDEAYDKLMDCSRIAINDIRKTRLRAKNPSYGQDPATPYLESILNGFYEGDLSGSACYAISNLGANWSASKLIKDKTSPEFLKKSDAIKACKKVIKGFCDHTYDKP